MAKCGVTNIGGGGGIGSDEVSATKDNVLNGKTFVGADTKDEIGTGSMADNGTTGNQKLNAGSSFVVKKGYHSQDFLVEAYSLASQTPGTAVANELVSGKTAWVNGSMVTGSMTVQSILSFSCAPYSSNQIIFTWQNPAKGPFAGTIIVGKTGGYPASISDGTRYYKGYGNNNGSSGTANTIISNFSNGTTYYFRAFSYATINNQEWVSSSSRTSNTTINIITEQFNTSTTWVVPNGVHSVNVFLVGGGGGGSWATGGNGGGGGYTGTWTINVSPGQKININVGAGGKKGYGYSSSSGENGGSTSFGNLSVAGGNGGLGRGGNGGSGGGGGGWWDYDNYPYNKYAIGGNGGSDGSDGPYKEGISSGTGQHRSTRQFGQTNGILYAGGGGGGSYCDGSGNSYVGGSAGSGGGGNGGNGYPKSSSARPAVAGASNTGGGGGGSGSHYSDKREETSQTSAADGGSGVCIIKYIT